MTENDRQQGAGWQGQPFPGPPPSPYPSGPPARPSSASGPPEARQLGTAAAPSSYRPPTSPTFTYSPPTAGQISRDQEAFSAGPAPQPPPGPPGPPPAGPPPVPPAGPPPVPPTAPLPGGPSPRPAPAPPPPSFGGLAPSPAAPPRSSESPFAAPPRQSAMPGQAAASEVHPTIRLQPPAPAPGAPAAWPAAPGPEQPRLGPPTDPFPQPGALLGDPYAPAPAKGGSGVGTRVLGVVVGLLLGLLGLVGVLVGQFSAEGNTTKGIWFGVGLLLLAAAVLLGSWTAAVPITAGAVGALPGLLGVVAPDTWGDLVDGLPEIDLGFDLAGITANGAIGALGSHLAAAAGVLLVVAGITTVLGRRRGAATARQA